MICYDAPCAMHFINPRQLSRVGFFRIVTCRLKQITLLLKPEFWGMLMPHGSLIRLVELKMRVYEIALLTALLLFLVWVEVSPAVGACDYYCQRNGGAVIQETCDYFCQQQGGAAPETRDYFNQRNDNPIALETRDYFGQGTGGTITPEKCDYCCRKNGDEYEYPDRE